MEDGSTIVGLLEELVAWTRFANRDALVNLLDQVLKDEQHLLAYELTDGKRRQLDVATEAGLAQSTLSGLWLKWRRLGLVREYNGKVVHLARPTDLGMERAARALASIAARRGRSTLVESAPGAIEST